MSDLRDEIARIIDPVNMSMTPAHYGLKSVAEFRRTLAFGAQLVAQERADAILAIPAIASALAGRDAVIEQCAGAAEGALVRCDWNGCHFAGPNPSGCAYPDDILEYRYSVDVAEAIRALKTGAAK